MKKKGIIIAISLAILVAVASFVAYRTINSGFNIDKTTYVYIDETKDFDALINELDTAAKIQNKDAFIMLADAMGYNKSAMRTGRYAITPDMTILQAVRMLRNGAQSPVKIKFNNLRLKKDLATRISEQLMMKEDQLLAALNDPQTYQKYGFNSETIVAMFIPNTYEIYWDVEIPTFLDKMKKEYDRFWDQQRLAKAKAIGITSLDVSILASIVEEECMYTDEYPTVAGLYINRLHSKQLLQADPTVKFAVGDFSLRRILDKHLQVDSPYNTYRHMGLPPAPIRIPSIKGIDAVLNYEKNNFIYMCAKEDFSGRHNFAASYAQHQQNAVKYRKALNDRNIYQ